MRLGQAAFAFAVVVLAPAPLQLFTAAHAVFAFVAASEVAPIFASIGGVLWPG